MRLAVVSDTHGHLPFARAAVHLLAALEVDEVLHCGDIDTPEVVRLFSPWPTHFVLGNVDRPTDVLQAAIAAEPQAALHGEFGELEREGKRIAFLHGHRSEQLHEAIHSGRYDLVCHGHTHIARLEQIGATWALNPGALFRAARHTVAIVTLPELTIEHFPI